jgi:ABC-type multidrug transport system fused ATPase/permease subunit
MGEILIDGVNIKDYQLQDYRKMIGFVMQEPTLFNYSIKDNIIYGDSEAKNSAILDAAKIANALEFIETPELESQLDDDTDKVIEHFANN